MRKGLIVLVAAFAGGVSAGPAAAGSFQVSVNLGANNTANGCNIFSVNGGGAGMFVTPPCRPAPLGGPAQLGFNFVAGNTGGGPITTAPQGERVGIQTTAPAGIAIIQAISSPAEITNINDGGGWGGGAYWAGGGRQWRTGDGSETDSGFASSYWGWQMICGSGSGCNQNAGIALNSVVLTGVENQAPSLSASGSNNLLSQTSHYVWNPVGEPYPIPVSTSDPSGVCQVKAVVNGTVVPGPSAALDTSQWHQCPDATWTVAGGATVDTRSYVPGAGLLSLQLQATNAAQVTTTDSATLKVDNDPVGLTLSGPSDATSTTGATQYVTTDVTAGPSGVAGALCSVDGGASTFYPGASAQVPVSGLGAHAVTCVGENTAVGPTGQPGTSAPQTFAMTIRQPTASGITFARIADALRCHTATEVVKVRGRLHTVRRHGKRVRVRGPARKVRRRVRKCHARTVVRTVRVVLRRHGKPVRRHGRLVYVKRRVRRVLLPHMVDQPTRRVGHGKATTANGLLELADGTVLPGRDVEVLAAPNNGSRQFALMATVTTNAYGEWSARVPAGPSRLLEAVYPGDETTEPATSGTVVLTVPAKIGVSIAPRVLPWHATLTIRGHLEGGDVPPGGVALRLLVRYTGSPQASVLLAFRTNGRGQFKIQWRYPSGHGVASYPMWVSTTAAETDYAFAPSRSRRMVVTFGRRTPHHHHRR